MCKHKIMQNFVKMQSKYKVKMRQKVTAVCAKSN